MKQYVVLGLLGSFSLVGGVYLAILDLWNGVPVVNAWFYIIIGVIFLEVFSYLHKKDVKKAQTEQAHGRGASVD